jgi:hypothetical protein
VKRKHIVWAMIVYNFVYMLFPLNFIFKVSDVSSNNFVPAVLGFFILSATGNKLRFPYFAVMLLVNVVFIVLIILLLAKGNSGPGSRMKSG